MSNGFELPQAPPQGKVKGEQLHEQARSPTTPIRLSIPTNAQQVSNLFDNIISEAATGMDMDAMQEMMSSRIAFEMKERDREEDEKEDVLGKRERVEESEEKERKEFKEEVREKEEVQQQLAEEIEKRMPVVMFQRYI